MAKGTKQDTPQGTEAGNDLTAPKPQFKRVEAVSVPTFSIPDDESSVYIKILEPFDTKPNIDIKTGKVKTDDDGKELEITIARVVDLTKTVDDMNPEEPMDLVVGVILKNEIEERYPEQAYVGQMFEIKKSVIKGKRAKAYKVWRIE